MKGLGEFFDMGQPKKQAKLLSNDIAVMQGNASIKMSVACCLACVIGMILMAVTAHYLLMALLAGVLCCCLAGIALFKSRKITVEIASLAPMLILCFAYTPASWFTFDGLIGCTPYLSILFSTMIVLTYYRKIQALLLSLYGALLLYLTLRWLMAWPGERDAIRIVNILVAYVITLAVILSIVEGVKRKSLEIQLSIADLSLHDGLTNLLNRRAIERVVEEKEREYQDKGADYAIVMMDVDRFKSINDRYGHNLGDSILQTLAECLQKTIRAADYAFRFGGDEFMLILSNVDDAMTCRIRDRIRAALQEVQGYAFPITISVGCALRSERPASAEAIELADRRMYEDKKGRDEEEEDRA